MEKSIYTDNKPNISLVPHHSNSFGSANSEKTQKNKKDELVLGHVLAIDFGVSKVGLAMADTETRIAFVYGVIPNDKDLLNKLTEIIFKEDVKVVVIGIPVFMHKAKEEYIGVLFGNKLKEKVGIEMKYQNEMFTTKMAQENIKERGERNIAQKDDQEAAKIILQDWLDKT